MNEDLPATKADIERLEGLMRTVLKKVKTPDYITVSDIAEMKGVSPRVLRSTKSYLLPRYGKTGIPGRTAKWTLDEYVQWEKTPLEERVAYFERLKK